MDICGTVVFFFALTSGLYASSFALLCFVRNAERPRRLARGAAWLGFASHTFMLCWYAFAVSRLPVGNPYEILVSLVWAFVFVQLAGAVAFKTSALLFFSMPAAALLLVLPVGCPLFFPNLGIAAAELGGASSAHAVLAIFSYAAFALAAAVSVLYAVQARALRRKRADSAFPDAPSLKRLLSFCRWSLTVSSALMFAAIVLGAIGARSFVSGGAAPPLYMLKFALGTLVFAVQILLTSLLWAEKLRPSRVCAAVALSALISFLLLIPMELKNFL